jgi:hypothetical protein
MTTRRKFLAGLAALIPAAASGPKAATAATPQPQVITVRVGSDQFNRAVSAAVVESYKSGGRIREVLRDA